ncbi:MAG: tail fiber assembly protein [Acetobacter sp.]|nr:tail fiber assembly protein [Acetobacter sp.]
MVDETTYNYYWSKTTCSFYPYELKYLYDNAGSWPTDAVGVSDDVFKEFGLATTIPDGKWRGAGTDGMPAWVDVPTPSEEPAAS